MARGHRNGSLRAPPPTSTYRFRGVRRQDEAAEGESVEAESQSIESRGKREAGRILKNNQWGWG